MGIASRVPDKKRIWAALTSVILVLVFILGIRGMLYSEGAYVPEARITKTDDERSQVFVGGSGYELDVKTKEEHKEQQEKRREILRERERSHQQTPAQKRMSETREEPKPEEQQTPNVKNSDNKSGKNGRNAGKVPSGKKSGSGNGGSGGGAGWNGAGRGQNLRPQSGKKVVTPSKKEEKKPKAKDPKEKKPDPKETPPSDKENKRPVIRTSLIDGRIMKGTSVSFWVQVKDYRDQVVPVFSNDEGHFSVYVNGEKLSSTGTSGEKTNFRADVVDGKNEIRIAATDRLGKEATKILTITCDTGEQAKPVGTVYVSAYAPSLGIGTIFADIAVDIMEQENLHDVLVDAFAKAGVSAEMSKSYLAAIKADGIAAGAVISDDLRERADKQRVTLIEREDWPNGWKNSLKEKDFCSHSGWIYMVNGKMPGVGINSFIPADGDEISLIFTLFDGDSDEY